MPFWNPQISGVGHLTVFGSLWIIQFLFTLGLLLYLRKFARLMGLPFPWMGHSASTTPACHHPQFVEICFSFLRLYQETFMNSWSWSIAMELLSFLRVYATTDTWCVRWNSSTYEIVSGQSTQKRRQAGVNEGLKPSNKRADHFSCVFPYRRKDRTLVLSVLVERNNVTYMYKFFYTLDRKTEEEESSVRLCESKIRHWHFLCSLLCPSFSTLVKHRCPCLLSR